MQIYHDFSLKNGGFKEIFLNGHYTHTAITQTSYLTWEDL